MPARDPNLPLLEEAAGKLAPLLEEIVFVGGVILGILISDPASAPVRATKDVDVIAEIITYADFIEFSERARAQGFTEDASEGAPACRLKNGMLKLDVLGIRKEVLGYTNIWYESALRNSMPVRLASGHSIQVMTAPFFLGAKMEAFRGRGQTILLPAMILKISLLWLRVDMNCWQKLKTALQNCETTWRRLLNRYSENPDSKMFCPDLFWMTLGFLSSLIDWRRSPRQTPKQTGLRSLSWILKRRLVGPPGFEPGTKGL